MSDREFLTWVYNRLLRFGDGPNLDFMLKLGGIIKATPPDRCSPIIHGELTEEPSPNPQKLLDHVRLEEGRHAAQF